MKSYNFDCNPERKGSGCIKYDGMSAFYGYDDLIPLWIADMDFSVAEEVEQALRKRTEHPIYGYPLVPDSYWESIIMWLRHRHGFEVTRSQITFVPGIVKAIGLAINYYTRKGDRIVIQPPVYHPFKRLIDGNERITIENPLLETPDGYTMDLAGLEKIFSEQNPKMMILCNPHNPCGIQWSEEILKEVGRLAALHNVIVISDEIHGDLMLEGRKHHIYLDMSDDCRRTGIMFGAPSKTFNIPGLVSSWCVIKNPALREGFFHWLEINELSSPMEWAFIATEAAYRNGEKWLDTVLPYIEANINYIDTYLKENIPTIKMKRPNASYLVWLDMRDLGLDDETLQKRMVSDAGLAMNPGSMFGKEGNGFMRFNAAVSRSTLEKALKKLSDALSFNV